MLEKVGYNKRRYNKYSGYNKYLRSQARNLPFLEE